MLIDSDFYKELFSKDVGTYTRVLRELSAINAVEFFKAEGKKSMPEDTQNFLLKSERELLKSAKFPEAVEICGLGATIYDDQHLSGDRLFKNITMAQAFTSADPGKVFILTSSEMRDMYVTHDRYSNPKIGFVLENVKIYGGQDAYALLELFSEIRQAHYIR